MSDYIAYNDDGKILRVMRHSGVDETKTAMAKEVNVMEGIANDATQYVKDGKVIDRPKMSLTVDKTSITADGTDAVTVKGIPDNTLATTKDHSVTVTDGTLIFTADTPGTYVLRFECFPYIDEEITINAT